MNKIYKVIWSKVKNQYVVVSELAHSNGKQSRTSRNSIRSRIAALVVCGAIAAFGVFSALPTSSAFAAAAETTSGQYIAVAFAKTDTSQIYRWEWHDENCTKFNNDYEWDNRTSTWVKVTGDTREFEDAKGISHTYKLQTDSKTNKDYWVRDGYSITIENDSRFTAYDQYGKPIAPENTYIIDSQKSDSADSEGLLSSSQVVISDDSKHTTLTGNELNSIDPGIYGGASNSGGTSVPSTWNYYINDNGEGWKDVGGPSDIANMSNFEEVHQQDDGTYNTKQNGSGITVSSDNLYVINGKLGAFFNSNGTVYTGEVYGHNNEVLMTGVENGTYYSYWGTEINDPNTSLSELTVGNLKDVISGINDSIYTAQGDDIKKIDVAKAKDGNGGTIGLVTRGDWKSDGQGNGQYVDTDPVPGTITIRNTDNSGKNGNDVAIRFGSIDEEGQDVEKFTIDAGSKVVGKTGADGTTEANQGDTLTGIEINGQNYKLGGGKTYTDGDGISISQDDTNTISVNTGNGLKIENDKVVANVDGTTVKTNEQGQLTATTLDEKGSGVTATSTYGKDYAVKDTAGNTVTIEDIASASKLGEVAGEAEKHTSVSTNDANLKVENTAQEGDAANYEVTLNKDLAVNSVTAGGENGTVINGNGLTVAGTQYVSAENGLNAGGKTIQNVAEGVGDKDAVNVSQLKKAIGDIDSYSGWTVTTNGGETDEDKAAVGSNGTVDFSADDANITIDQDGTNLKFGLANDLNVNKITTKNMYVTNVDDGNNLSVVNVGYFKDNEKHIMPTMGDASYEASEDGTVTLKYADGSGKEIKDTVAKITGLASDKELADKTAAAKTEVLQGTNVSVTKNDQTADGHTAYTVNAYDTQITGDGNVSVTGGELDENNVRNYNVKLADVITVGTSESAEHPVIIDGTSGQVTGLTNTDLKVAGFGESNRAATEEQLKAAMNQIDEGSYKGWTVTTNGGKTEEDKAAVASNGSVDFSNTDKNIIVGQTGTNLTFDLNDNITLGDESGTRIQLNGNPQKDSMISITNKDSDTVFNVAKDGTVHSDGDIVAKADSNKKYSLSEVGENAVRYNENKSTVALAGTNGTTITNVADGDVSEGSKEAVNGSQLYATNQKVDAGWVATDGTNKIEVNPTDSGTTTLKFAGDNNITVTADTTNKAIQVALNDKVYLGGDHTEDSRNIVLDGERGVIGLGSNIALDGRDGTAVIGGVNIDTAYDEATGKPSSTITGLSNTTWTDEIATAAADKKSEAAGTAATQGQLGDVASDLSDQITNSGWTASTNNGAVTTDITNGDKVDFANTDGNIAVNQTAVKDDKGNITGTNLTFDLNPDITLDDDVEDGNSVQLSGTNGTINAHNSELIFGGTGKYDNVNDMTFNQNGLTVTNTQTMRDTGETTTSSTVINGGSIATGNITAGGITVNADNGGTVNGLTNKTWDADNYVSGQAATEDQLKSVSDKVNAGWIATDSQNNEVNITPDNNKLNFAGDENVTVTAANNEIKVALNDDITLKGDSSSIELTGTKGTIQVNQETAEGTNFTNINGNVVSIGYTNSEGIENAIVIDGGKGTITGLSNTTWDDELATQVANSEELQGTAATQGQLQQAVNEVAEVANAGWNAKAGGNTINVKPNETLNFEGDGNITVSATSGTSSELKFGLNHNITLDNVKDKNTMLVINTDGREGYIPDNYKDSNEDAEDFIRKHGGFAIYYANPSLTTGDMTGTFGVTTDGVVHAKDVISYYSASSGSQSDVIRYSLNDVGDIVTQISHAVFDEGEGSTGMEYTLISDFEDEADKDSPFDAKEGKTRTIGLAVRQDGAVIVGAVVNDEGISSDRGIRINAETKTTYDENGNEVTNNIATITGLENTEWKPKAPEQTPQAKMATFAANDGTTTTETSRAATEAQLDDLYNVVSVYNTFDNNGNVNYNTIKLRGDEYSYNEKNPVDSKGTSITNVAYASGTDGSEAVNVDYLNDAINNAVKDGGAISDSDRHLQEGTYHVNDQGKVELIVADEKGENQSTVTIDNIANKNDITNLDNKIDNTFNDLNDKINNIDNVETDVKGGNINEDGTISLKTENEDGTTTNVTLKGQLTDSGVVQEGTSFDKETGTITITSQDKYSGKTSSVTVDGIASTDVVGVTTKEELADKYKAADKDGNATTAYITESESMVEADVALDHAIQDVAGTSYANDMVLSNRIDSVEKRLGNVEERIDKVGAMAAAIANLRTMGFDPEAPTEIAIGVGQYKSETGIAIGVFHYPNQDFMLSASLSSSGDELMGGIGATWKLGRKSAAERAKDEEARHLEQAEEMKKLAQQEKVKAQAQRHAKLLAERQQASQKNA